MRSGLPKNRGIGLDDTLWGGTRESPRAVLHAVAPAVPLSLVLLGLFVGLFVFVGAANAAGFPAGEGIRRLCEGDCSLLDEAAASADASSPDFDFELGLQVVLEGLSIRIVTEGDLYVVGPVHAEGDLILTALGVYLGSANLETGIRSGSGGEITLRAGAGDVTLNGGGVSTEISAPEISIADLPDLGIPPSGGLEIGPDGTIRLASAVQTDSSSIQPGPFDFVFETEGDVYLDLSQAVVGSLSLKALGNIVVSDISLAHTAIPEPGSAVCLGLGLVLLGIRRPHPRP